MRAGIEDAARGGCTVVAVEEPWGRNEKGQRTVLCVKTMVEETATAAGLIYEVVHPSQWKAMVRTAWGMKLAPAAAKRIGRLLAERRLAECTQRLSRPQGLCEDEADAYWIARCMWQRAGRLA